MQFKHLQKAGRSCLLSNHCNSDTYTDRIGCLADKRIFPSKSRKLHRHLWQKTATSKSSTNNFPRKWLDTQCKSEKIIIIKYLNILEVSTACLILGTDINAKWMLQTDCSIYFFLDAVWGHAKSQSQPHAWNVQQLFLSRSWSRNNSLTIKILGRECTASLQATFLYFPPYILTH